MQAHRNKSEMENKVELFSLTLFFFVLVARLTRFESYMHDKKDLKLYVRIEEEKKKCIENLNKINILT